MKLLDTYQTSEVEEIDLAALAAQTHLKPSGQKRPEQLRYSEAETLFERLSSLAGLLQAYSQGA